MKMPSYAVLAFAIVCILLFVIVCWRQHVHFERERLDFAKKVSAYGSTRLIGVIVSNDPFRRMKFSRKIVLKLS